LWQLLLLLLLQLLMLCRLQLSLLLRLVLLRWLLLVLLRLRKRLQRLLLLQLLLHVGSRGLALPRARLFWPGLTTAHPRPRLLL